MVSWEDNSGSGRATPQSPGDGPVLGAREHQLPRRLHALRELRRESGALPNHLPQRQAHHRRGGLLREPHAADGGEPLDLCFDLFSHQAFFAKFSLMLY